MQHSTRTKRKEKSVFDASHFEESDNNGSSGTEAKQVRFKRPSTPSRSSRSRTSKPIARCLPTLQLISFLLLPLLAVSVINYKTHLVPIVNAAINATRPYIKVLSSSLVRALEGVDLEVNAPEADTLKADPPETQIPPHIADYVRRAIGTALKSAVERPDFASRSSGSFIVSYLTTSAIDSSCELDDTLLDEVPGTPSCCFFDGDRGQIAIRLSQLIRPTHVAVDYTPPTPSMSRHAPQRMVLWGLIDGSANKALFKSLSIYRDQHRSLGDGPPHSGGFVFLPFAEFTFDIDAAFPLQTFPIHPEAVFSGMTSGVYVLEIRSNWEGNSTGLCRIRIHGDPVV